MTDRWDERVHALELGPVGARRVTQRFRDLAHQFGERIGDAGTAAAWWVPGRIELLGKHTDYGGGRSLLCAIERGFHVLAAPRPDRQVRIIDASSGSALTIPLTADVAPRPGHWSDYPIAVVRRVARDFPEAATGMDVLLQSSLPSASGLSSSSALVIAVFLALADLNGLRETATWRAALGDPDLVAGYVGAMENGRAFGPFPGDRGVGTHGGSEDQTAILRCRAGEIAQYRFLPVAHEASIPLPPGWLLAVASSGVHAAKGGPVQARYNALARDIRLIREAWCAATGREDESLLAAIESAPDAGNRLAAVLVAAGSPQLAHRFEQFRAESEEIIPAVATSLAAGNVAAIGALVDRSQAYAESTLHNQTAETVHLVRRARALGAAAASAFGAGFGGSVWAMVEEPTALQFAERWRREYLDMFPARAARAEFFVTGAGPAARPI